MVDLPSAAEETRSPNHRRGDSVEQQGSATRTTRDGKLTRGGQNPPSAASVEASTKTATLTPPT